MEIVLGIVELKVLVVLDYFVGIKMYCKEE